MATIEAVDLSHQICVICGPIRIRNKLRRPYLTETQRNMESTIR